MSKITDYSFISALQSDDVLPIVDVHDPTQAIAGTTKKIPVSALDARYGFATPDWKNVVTTYFADPTGVADSTTAISNALAAIPASGGVVYLPTGTYLLQGAAAFALSIAGTTIVGDGPGATIIKIGGSFSAAQVFNVTAGYCQISGLSIVGASSTITSNPAADAILLQGGRYCRVDNVFFQYINGWCVNSIATNSNAGFATMLTRLSGLSCAGGVHVKSNTNVTWGAQHFLSNLNFQQIGVGSGANANLDVFRFEDCWDITAENFNAAVSDASTGSTINVVGKCSSLYFTNMDLGTFPNSSSETNSVITIQAGANGSPADVRFLQGEVQQGLYGVTVSGASSHIWFNAFRFFNNFSHGALVTGTAFEIEFHNCSWNSNGQGASGTNYDLEWSGTATGDVIGCLFSSPVVAVNSPGVQNPMDFNASGVVSVKDCNAYGTGTTSSNVFNTTPKYVFRTQPWNPHGTVAISVPTSGTTAAGRTFDMYFYITAGASTCTCVVTNGPSIVIPSGAFGVVFVPAGQQMTPTYTSAPTWVVYGN